ncbi:metallophosphoesterase [Olivibacter ginsenosidimutans]|uniref:Metallophosphoesterase n=1 Tax=Olivibacter ginsenosidimutans TaxID=1176537 RepID=A0ABP9BUP8_9SPHI
MQLCSYGQQAEKPIRFGIIADPQYADKDDHGTRFYRNALQKLDTAVTFLNTQPLDFTVILGDFVDQGIKDLPPVMERLEKLKMPVYNVLGNHDYVDAPDRQNLYRHFKMKAPYYTFAKGEWLFIILNTNELSAYATNDNSTPHDDWAAMSDQLKAAGRKNVYPWNGGISKKQFQWMEKQLISAERKGKKVIILSHHPLFPENGLEALNNREILAAIDQHPCVRAVISGHHHPGNFAYYKDIPMITLEGMVETAHQNAYGTVKLSADTMIIEGHGRLSSRTLTFKH